MAREGVGAGAIAEAPITLKTYLMCAFAAFGGIFFGYDSGYINGVLGMTYFIKTFEGLVSTLTPRKHHNPLTRPGSRDNPRQRVCHPVLEEILDRLYSLRGNLLWCYHCR